MFLDPFSVSFTLRTWNQLQKTLTLFFAGDTKLIPAIKELSDKNDQLDLIKVSEWSTSHNMVLHELKLNKSALLGNLSF